MTKKPAKSDNPVIHFTSDFHWPTSGTSSLTFKAGHDIPVDQDVADAAVAAGFGELISGEINEPLPAPASEIEEAE